MNSPACRFLSALLLLTPAVRAAEPAAPAKGAAEFPLEAYAALGSAIAQNTRLPGLGWNDAQIEAFLGGLRAAFKGKPYALDERTKVLQADIRRRLQEIAAKETSAGGGQEYFADPARLEAYLKEAAKTLHLERSDSGLAYNIISRGEGARPGPDDTVVISCKVTTADAKTDLPQLGADHRRIKVSELLPGLAEGAQMMTKDSVGMFILPPDLSFGQNEWPAGVERGTPLIFTLALHEVIVAP